MKQRKDMVLQSYSFIKIVGLVCFAVVLSHCSRNEPPAEVEINQELSPYHTVQVGETVTSIARVYNMKRSELVRLNSIKPPYKVYKGQRLLINLVRDKPTGARKKGQEMPTIKGRPNVSDTGEVEVKQLDETSDNTSTVGAAPAAEGLGTVMSVPVETAGGAAASVEMPATPEVTSMAKAEPPVSAGSLTWPVKGKIIKPYGDATSGQKNEGINIAAPAETPVVAVDNGVVAHVGNQIRGFGNVVLVKHANGKISVYGHLKNTTVKANQTVQAGQQIGNVGTTGGVSQPQVHFELRQGKKSLNPMEYLH